MRYIHRFARECILHSCLQVEVVGASEYCRHLRCRATDALLITETSLMTGTSSIGSRNILCLTGIGDKTGNTVLRVTDHCSAVHYHWDLLLPLLTSSSSSSGRYIRLLPPPPSLLGTCSGRAREQALWRHAAAAVAMGNAFTTGYDDR